ncbi:G-patch domain [Trypanosoma melophagium]|uniref:G-patch domain n=1 Tax=Trypanosoma melophagium TaxID=715481 RepID=UPI00351A8F96|nr:G-patch domain [Trypanosoma melophagium]
MSSIAKKMLERHGWQEGMGLGRNAQGVSTYIKVVRRDPHSATGLGHAADATQAPQASTFAAELDAVYSDISAAGKRKRVKKNKEEEKEKEEEEKEIDAVVDTHKDRRKHKGGNDQKNSKQKRSRDSSSEAASNSDSNSNSNSTSDDNSSNSSSSSSSSSSSNDDDNRVDITRMTDGELLRRCGGVRLGRAGRHRFFEGKLRRIEASHRE